MSVIEICARAIYESHQFVKPWEHPDTVRIHHAYCRREARAVLTTLRDNVSEEMHRAGSETADEHGCDGRVIFTAMLTAAMGE